MPSTRIDRLLREYIRKIKPHQVFKYFFQKNNYLTDKHLDYPEVLDPILYKLQQAYRTFYLIIPGVLSLIKNVRIHGILLP